MTPCLKRLGSHVLNWSEVLHDALPEETGQPCADMVQVLHDALLHDALFEETGQPCGDVVRLGA